MSNYKVNFTRVDNWANVFVNDLCVFSQGFDGKLPQAQSIDITPYLVKGNNTVRIDGVNYGPWKTANPFRFDYTITKDSAVISTISQVSNVRTPTPGPSYVGASSSLLIVI